MADYTLSALSYAKVFQKELLNIGNSSAGFLRFLGVDYVPNIAIDFVVTDGDGYDQSHGYDFAEMGTLATYSTNPQLTPSLAWGRQGDSFQVSGTSLRSAPQGNPDGLMNLMKFLVDERVRNVAQRMGSQAFTGTQAAGNKIVGLQEICQDSNIYANINRASTPAWRALVRDLTSSTVTLKNVQDWINAVAERNGNMMPDMCITTYAIQSKIASLLNVNGNYDVFGPPGTDLRLQGGYRALEMCNVPIIADKNCPAGEFYCISTSALRLKVHPFVGIDGWQSKLDPSDQSGPLPFQMGIRSIPTTLDSVAFAVGIESQLVCTNPARLLRAVNVGS